MGHGTTARLISLASLAGAVVLLFCAAAAPQDLLKDDAPATVPGPEFPKNISAEEALKLIRGGNPPASQPAPESLESEVIRLRADVARLNYENAELRRQVAAQSALSGAGSGAGTGAGGASATQPGAKMTRKPRVYRSIQAVFDDVPKQLLPTGDWSDPTEQNNLIGWITENIGGQTLELHPPFKSGEFYARRPSKQQTLMTADGTPRPADASRIVFGGDEFRIGPHVMLPDISAFFSRDRNPDLQRLKPGDTLPMRGRIIAVKFNTTTEPGKIIVSFVLEDADLLRPPAPKS